MTDEQVQKDINFLSGKLETSDLKKRYHDALKTIQGLTKEVDAIKQIKSSNEIHIIKTVKSKSSEATAVILASDWHIEELVNPKTINGLNEFNLEIAEERVGRFFINASKMIKTFQRDIKIKNIILWLGGDFISSSIHEELLENTCLRPIEAIQKAQAFIKAGIQYLLNNTNCTLTIPCNVGN